jgi:hypothetical protein
MDGSDRGGAPQEQQQDAAAEWQRAMAMAQQQRRPGGRLPGLYASLPASLHDQECAGASSKRWLALQRARCDAAHRLLLLCVGAQHTLNAAKARAHTHTPNKTPHN